MSSFCRLLVVGLIPLTVLSYLNTKIYVVIRYKNDRGKREKMRQREKD